MDLSAVIPLVPKCVSGIDIPNVGISTISVLKLLKLLMSDTETVQAEFSEKHHLLSHWPT